MDSFEDNARLSLQRPIINRGEHVLFKSLTPNKTKHTMLAFCTAKVKMNAYVIVAKTLVLH